MSFLNIVSLITGTPAGQTASAAGGAVSAEQANGQASSEFAPVLNEQVQQLQNAAQGQAQSSTPVPGLVAAFLQRLSIIATDEAGAAAGEGGEKIQALMGKILELLQQQMQAALGQGADFGAGNGAQAGAQGKGNAAITVETLVNLQPAQVQEIAELLGTSYEEVEMALSYLVKEHLDGASEFVVPVATQESDTQTLSIVKAAKKAGAAIIADGLIDLATIAKTRVVVENAEEGKPLASAAVVVPSVFSALEAVRGADALIAEEAEVEIVAEVSGESDSLDSGAELFGFAAATFSQSGEQSSSEDESADTIFAEEDAEDNGEEVIAEDLLGMPIIVAAPQPLPVLATSGTQTIIPQALADSKSSASSVLGTQLKSGFRGVAGDIPDAVPLGFEAAGRSVRPLPTKAELGLPANANAKMNANEKADLAQRAIQASDRALEKLGADKNADKIAEQIKRATSSFQPESRIELPKDIPIDNNVKFAPRMAVDEIAPSRDFLDSTDSGVRKIGEVAEGLSALREAPATALRKGVDRSAELASRSQQSQSFPPVAEQVVVRMRDVANKDAKQIQISLDPKELGKVDVRMDVANDGRTQITMTVDKKETLDLLQRDRVSLEKALAEMGMKTDSGSMNFNLREQPRGQQQMAEQNMQQGGRGWQGEPLPEELREELQPTQPYRAGYILAIDEGVNISV